MSIKNKACIVGAVLLLSALFALPVSAVIQETNGMGTVFSVNDLEKTITINSGYQYTITYSGSTPNEEWIESTQKQVTGTVPDDSALDTFKAGDPVRFIILGGDGGRYLGIAKMTEVSPKARVTDLIGDPDRMIFKQLTGGYILSTETDPICSECTGTTCEAAFSNIKVVKDSVTLTEEKLLPGKSYIYETKNPEDYDFSILFVKGEAAANICSSTKDMMMTGPQPVSVYEIHITPGKLPATKTPAAETQAPTQESPGFAFLITATAIAGAVLFIKRD
ncbi:hypothetical protein F1737_00985 [Methanoplanus sp. FWC-SCC4]|uniref:Uncharacterized protein n=1 Tax=Methanochimaera problematica TaxID=2609417 RepID=A0AA97FAF1_9EURY|nr:hypothetical protein [Methanoplanus sp. FWC-SCC4]WOF15354.1 hypothetical protein F1737_00985 [Methanoplanus sp. FWC-SCC4]